MIRSVRALVRAACGRARVGATSAARATEHAFAGCALAISAHKKDHTHTVACLSSAVPHGRRAAHRVAAQAAGEGAGGARCHMWPHRESRQAQPTRNWVPLACLILSAHAVAARALLQPAADLCVSDAPEMPRPQGARPARAPCRAREAPCSLLRSMPTLYMLPGCPCRRQGSLRCQSSLVQRP